MSVFKPGQVVFVTKYALTAGIQQATVCSHQSREGATYLALDWPGACNDRAIFYPGKSMFATIEEAQANVAKQCERKLKSLTKQTEAIRHIAAHGATVLPVRLRP